MNSRSAMVVCFIEGLRSLLMKLKGDADNERQGCSWKTDSERAVREGWKCGG